MAAKPVTQTQSPATLIEVDGRIVNLRNRNLAALLAWLVPGAGHYYQGRRSKAALFFLVIMTTYFIGFAIGGGHVVYASWVPGDKRWHYVCQLGAGAVSLPALIQANHLHKNTDFTSPTGQTRRDFKPYWGGFMAPPRRPVQEDKADDIAAWYARLGAGYEMGTWYTMIAGLLNILVIYDAFSGPLSTPISGRKRDDNTPADGNAAAESSSTKASPAETGSTEKT